MDVLGNLVCNLRRLRTQENNTKRRKQMERKTTKHAIGNVYYFLNEYLQEHKGENLKVSGIEFSNLGAQGREPLFDVSRSQKGTIMAYWKDDSKKCIVITTPEPGFEVKAQQNMEYFFYNSEYSSFLISHLDVTHLDVSNVTNFANCFSEFGSAFGKSSKSKIVGLETWDVSKGEIFNHMFYGAFPVNDAVELNLSAWRFGQQAKIWFWSMFGCFAQKAKTVILDTTGWNTTNVNNFDSMFFKFAPSAEIVEIKGIENWRLGTGRICLRDTFKDFAKTSSSRLDLSEWARECTEAPDMEGFTVGTFFRIKEPAWAN